MLHIRTETYANCLDCGQTVQILSDRIPAPHVHTGLYSCWRKKPRSALRKGSHNMSYSNPDA